ncbi:hypothetical protein ACFQAS_01755 [Halopenitus salinus]|uniref:DUF3153 domain-containing protein n=1 Tax=Halopenitus salinus TaxID=1198295 RepID=A0ABD5UTM4_9EURY
MNRKVLAAVAVALLVGLSGCATISVTAEVGDANTIERYDLNITTSTTVYGWLNEAAKEEGYESLRDQMTDDVDVESDRIEYSEEIDGDEATINIQLSEIPSSEMDAITLEEDDGELTYTDTAFVNESAQSEETSELGGEAMSGLVLDYTLHMPGNIVESNADEVDGNTANWTRTGGEAYTNTHIEARSEMPSALPVTGFGIVAAGLGILMFTLLLTRTRKQ